jgi:hypothetical protein
MGITQIACLDLLPTDMIWSPPVLYADIRAQLSQSMIEKQKGQKDCEQE